MLLLQFWDEIRLDSDILILIGVLIITFFLIGFEVYGPLRIISGITVILFLPGYILQAALLPKNNEITSLKIVVLSIALSATVVPLVILILNYTPWGINVYSVMITLCIYTAVVCFIVIYRRRISFKKRCNPSIAFKMLRLQVLPKWQEKALLDRVFIVVLLLTAVFTGVCFHIFTAAHRSVPFSEFYMINNEGSTHGGFISSTNDGEMEVILGVVNHEHENAEYIIKVNINGNTQKAIGPFHLQDSEKLEEAVRFTPSLYQKLSKVEFILLKNSDQSVYRSIHFWVNNINNGWM